MSLDWYITDKAKPGFEIEFKELRDYVYNNLDGGAFPEFLTDEQNQQVARLKEISVTWEETWNQFLYDQYSIIQSNLYQDKFSNLPQSIRQQLVEPFEDFFPTNHSSEFDLFHNLIGDMRYQFLPITARQFHLFYSGFGACGFPWRQLSRLNNDNPIYNLFHSEINRDLTPERCLLYSDQLVKTINRAFRGFTSDSNKSKNSIAYDFSMIANRIWLDRMRKLDSDFWKDFEILLPVGMVPNNELDLLDQEYLHGLVAAFELSEWLHFWGSHGHGTEKG